MKKMMINIMMLMVMMIDEEEETKEEHNKTLSKHTATHKQNHGDTRERESQLVNDDCE